MTRHYLAACLFSFSAVAFAQVAPSIQWQRSLGGSVGDEASCIRETSDGGLIIAGAAGSQNGDVMGSHGGDDYWVAKLDYRGNLSWSKCYGGSNDDEANCIEQTSDGGYIVGGFTESHDLDVVGNSGVAACWIVKLDATGNMQWSQCYGGSASEVAYGIEQSNDGGYIFAGRTVSKDGDVKDFHPGLTGNCWIVKITSRGSIEWEKTLGGNGSGSDWASSVRQTGDGGYIVGCRTASNDGDVVGFHGGVDFWVVKMDHSGGVLWKKCYGGSREEDLGELEKTKDGGFVLSGYSNSNDINVTGNHGSQDYWTLKIDSAGNIVWQRSLGGSSQDMANCVQQTSDGGFIVAGYAMSTDGDLVGIHNNDTPDYWVVKFDSLGKTQWQKCVGGSGSDFASSIRQTKDGGFVVAGNSDSKDGDATDNQGQADYWIVKLAFIPKITSLQQRAFSPLLCGTETYDTVWVHNTGSGTLIVRSSAFSAFNQYYSVVSPTVFPLSISVGDSTPFVVKFAPQIAGTLVTTLNLESNDSLPGHHPWPITFTGRKDSVEIVVAGAPGDTLDFGYLACGVNKDLNITLDNKSTIPTTVTLQSNPPSVFTVAPSAYLKLGSQQSVPVHFTGTGIPGTYTSTLSITDTCGRSRILTLVARADIPVFTILAAPDTMICPGDSVKRITTIRNLSRADQTVQLSTTSPLCSVTPSSTLIAPGASTTVEIVFHGSVATGVYPVAYTMTDSCGGVHETTMTVHVAAPAITVTGSFAITVCPFTPATVTLPVMNVDSVVRALAFTCTTSALSQSTATLRPGETDSLAATYPGGAVGVYPCVIHIVDECGIAHDVTMTVNVQSPPPLALMPSDEPTAVAIGMTEKEVYIIATPASAISGSDITFTVVNEPTALQFDSATSRCGIRVMTGANAATITVSGCGVSTSDTIATLFYQTLVGATLSPSVTLLNASTKNACQSITGSGSATITLLPPGCELGTVVVHPFATGIQSVYPNPATGSTMITYATVEDGSVGLVLYDALGRTVQSVVQSSQKPGVYSALLETRGLMSGAYLLMLRVGSRMDAKELLIAQ